jgi:hypothetical protein
MKKKNIQIETKRSNERKPELAPTPGLKKLSRYAVKSGSSFDNSKDLR